MNKKYYYEESNAKTDAGQSCWKDLYDIYGELTYLEVNTIPKKIMLFV